MKNNGLYDLIDVKSETLDKLRGISKKIDKLIDICQEEWNGNSSRIGSFKISLKNDSLDDSIETPSLTISFSPRFHFGNSKNLDKIKEIILDDSDFENFLKNLDK